MLAVAHFTTALHGMTGFGYAVSLSTSGHVCEFTIVHTPSASEGGEATHNIANRDISAALRRLKVRQ